MFIIGNIRFRAIEKSDLKLLHEWQNDYKISLLNRAEPLSFVTMEELEQDYDAMVKSKKTTRFILEDIGISTAEELEPEVENDQTVEDMGVNEPIGLARITVEEGDVRAANIGLYIAYPVKWNKGIGKIVTLGMLEMLFYHRVFEKVNAGSAEFNVRAHKVLEYCGFKREGVHRKGIKLYGKYYSWYQYGILYEEYMPIREDLLQKTLKKDYNTYIQNTTLNID